MQVKVGQVWKNKLGDRLEIIGISKTDFAWKMDDGEIGCTLLKYWYAIQEPTLVSNSPLSDLEIVQKALHQLKSCADGEMARNLCIYGDGSWDIEAFDSSKMPRGSDTKSLLTWAKQTIGHKS